MEQALGAGYYRVWADSVVMADLDRRTAREALDGRGVEVSEIQDFPWGRFVFFADPDGNRWAVQQLVQDG